MGEIGFLLEVERARGTKVTDSKGKVYTDFFGGYGVLTFGHNHPVIADAIRAHLDYEAPIVCQASLLRPTANLAEQLVDEVYGRPGYVFFGNSGTEAVEAAIKVAKGYHGERRHGILSLDGGFHGKTIGSLSVSGREKYKQLFRPLMPGGVTVPINDIAAVTRELNTKKYAAIIIETVQGEGGVHVCTPEFIAAVAEACQRTKTLLIDDSVQTGLGRCGSMYGMQSYGVVPDIICLSKALGGGFVAIGATITRASVWEKVYGSNESCLAHTSTYGGNGLATTVGLAALSLVTDELMLNCDFRSEQLITGLQEIARDFSDLVEDVRGQGLLLGIEMKALSGITGKLIGGFGHLTSGTSGSDLTAALVAGLLRQRGFLTVFTLNQPNVIRIEPPLIVTEEECAAFLLALRESLKQLREEKLSAALNVKK